MATMSALNNCKDPGAMGALSECQLNYSKDVIATRAINASVALTKMPMQQG